MPGFNSIDGLMSGLDTTSIVDTILKFERQQAVLLEQEQSQKQNIISAYQSLSAKFIGLNSSIIPLTKESTFEQSSVNVSDSDVLSAVSNGRVGDGSYSFQVLALARNHQVASQGFASADAKSFGTGSITVQVGNGNSREILIDSENNSLTAIKNAINKQNIGVTASIVNDGTTSNAYRLILTSNKTGVANSIKFNANLTGGSDEFNFSTATFDIPESVLFDDSSTSAVTLGTLASYSGTQNKSYTFTVASPGEQTVGSDVITLDWTDGINSGSIVVTQADMEVELDGAGADGLSLMFSSGTLNEGDSFEVNTFAPNLQNASDAKIAFGAGGGGGSPIVISSDSNTFSDVIENVDITVKGLTGVGESVSINTSLDTTAIKEKIQAFLTAYNELTTYIDNQNKYTEDDESAPALFGDSTVWNLSNSLRRNIGSIVQGIDSKYNQLYSVGIRTKADGKLSLVNASALEEALKNNLDDVIKLFTDSANSTNAGIEYISSTEQTRSNTAFDVNITQAATRGGYTGKEFESLSTAPITLTGDNNRIKLKIDGLLSDEILLSEKTYSSTAELISELQVRIGNDAKIGKRDITVEWVDTGAGRGYIKFSSGSYGSASKVEMDKSIGDSVYTTLNLTSGSVVAGKDVEGTINGEEAVGSGQLLSGKKDSKTISGLQLKVTLDEASVNSGNDGTIEVVKGVASKQVDFINNITASKTGIFDVRITSLEKQITNLTERIAEIDERLAIRRETLFEQYYAMETALSELGTQGDYLTTQFDSINANWGLGSKR